MAQRALGDSMANNVPYQTYELPGKVPVNNVPATQSQGNVLPARLTNAQRQHQPVRNSDLGQAGSAAVGSTAAAIGTAGAVASLAAVPSIAALAPFLTNPWTAPVAAVLAAGIVAGPAIYNKIRIANTDRKIKQHEKSFEKYSQMNQDDPNVQAKLQYHQEKLGMWQQNWSNITHKPYPTPIGITSAQAAGQAPLPRGLSLPGQAPQEIGENGQPLQPGQEQQGLLPNNLIQPTAGVAGGGQYGGGDTPQGDFWGGKRAYTEQVPLFTPNQQAYQNETIQRLRENRADFGPIRNEELRRFHEETAPQIAEQYFGRNPNSFGSAYPEALGRGGALLGSKLASAQAQFEAEREQRQQQVAIQPSYTSVQHPRESGFGENLATSFTGAAAQALAKGAGSWLSNKWGGKTDAKEDTSTESNTTPTKTNISPVNQQTYQNQQPAPLSNFPGPYSPNLVNDPAGIQKLLMQQQEKSTHRGGGRTR